jgi:hypothetical protein
MTDDVTDRPRPDVPLAAADTKQARRFLRLMARVRCDQEQRPDVRGPVCLPLRHGRGGPERRRSPRPHTGCVSADVRPRTVAVPDLVRRMETGP